MLLCKGAIATLRLFPYSNGISFHAASRCHYGLEIINEETTWTKKGSITSQLARRSIGTRQALDAYKFHLEQLLEEYDLAVKQLERVEQEVKECS